MAFTKLEKDMNIIQKLDDEPNDVGGMTSAELKAKFDEGNNAMKEWINNVFIPEAEAALMNALLGQIDPTIITPEKIGAALATHATQHSASGADPITPHMIGAKSNENLGRNCYFADPIDQRGGYVVPPGAQYWSSMVDGTLIGTTNTYHKATVNATRSDFYEITIDGVVYYVYTGDGNNIVRGYVGAGYTIDGWKMGASLAVVIDDGRLRIINSAQATANISFYQIAEEGVWYGKTVTFSVLTENGLYSLTGTVPDSKPDANTLVADLFTEDKSNRFQVWMYPTGQLAYALIPMAGGADVLPIAAKLELGSTQTLAHRDENGNWVLNDPPPNKALELAKCQRYYREFNNREGWVPLGIARWRSQYRAELVLQLPVSMRIPPTVVMPDLHAVTMIPHDGSADRNPSAMSLNVSTRDAVVIHIDCAEAIGEIGCCTEIWLNRDAVKTRLAVDAGM